MSAKVIFNIIDGPIKGQEFVFEEHDLLLFGRSQDSHVRLPKEDATASRDHFILELNPPYARIRGQQEWDVGEWGESWGAQAG
jgi:serine/threonine-protein kinase